MEEVDTAVTVAPPIAPKENSKNSNWEQRFMQVVWAKSGGFPWWPSYVIDPKRLSSSEEGFAKAQKLVGKQYVVLFYADKTLGFISPKDLKPFNEETLATYSTQKIANRYKTLFPLAIEQALADSKLEPADRLSWYFVSTFVPPEPADDAEEASYFDESEAASLGFDFDEEDELPISKQNITPKEKKRKIAEVSISDEEDNDVPSDTESNDGDELSNSFSDDEVKRPKKKRLIKKKKSEAREHNEDRQQKRRGRPKGSLNKSTFPLDGDDDDDDEEENAGIHRKISQKKKVTATTAPSATTEAAVSSKKSAFSEESKLDRLIRLTGILELTISPGSEDLKRALKTLDKISEIGNISMQEFLKSEIVKAVKAAKKVGSEELRKKAEVLLDTWKRSVSTEEQATSAPIHTSIPNPPPVLKSNSGNNSSDQKQFKPNEKVSTITPTAKSSSSRVEVKPLAEVLRVERARALRMLRESTGDSALATKLEETLFTLYGSTSTSPVYFEAVTRVFCGIRTNTIRLNEIRIYLTEIEQTADTDVAKSLPFLINFHASTIDM